MKTFVFRETLVWCDLKWFVARGVDLQLSAFVFELFFLPEVLCVLRNCNGMLILTLELLSHASRAGCKVDAADFFVFNSRAFEWGLSSQVICINGLFFCLGSSSWFWGMRQMFVNLLHSGPIQFWLKDYSIIGFAFLIRLKFLIKHPWYRA